jgi:hypothetical protein
MTSRTFSFTVQSALPTPNSGQVILRGTNTVVSSTGSPPVKDPAFTSSQWNYALFDDYGGGAFMADYGTHGGYVMAGIGAHGPAPSVIDAVVFDFGTETWSRLVNADNAPNMPNDYSVSQTTGSPEYEISTSAFPLVTPNTVPAPCHTYCNAVAVGTKYILSQRAAVTSASVNAHRAHWFDCNPASPTYKRWQRLSTNRANEIFGKEATYGTALYDPHNNRIWQCNDDDLNLGRRLYLNLTTLAWSQITFTPFTPAGTGKPDSILVNDGTNVGILHFLIGATTGYIMNLKNIAAGWQTVTFNSPPLAENGPKHWHRYPADGAYYSMPNTPGQTIWKLAPPSNPFSGQWTVSTRPNPTGSAFPAKTGGLQHHACFMYVPARNCFAWIAGNDKQVALWKP